MSALLRSLGTVMLLVSALGMAALGASITWPGATDAIETNAQRLTGVASGMVGNPPASAVRASGVQSSPAMLAAATSQDLGRLAITRLAVPAIDLDADVVPADLVQRDGGLTWEVPAFRVGHAEGTAGAGQVGNAILLGHVTSLRSGNVFADLDRAEIGHTVQIFTGERELDYTVVSKRHVSRDDRTVGEPGQARAVSLITCTGVWLPTIWDYTERLVVRAELSQDRTHDR